MKAMKITTFSMLSIVSLALLFSACGNAGNTTVNNSTANTANKSNTAVVANSNQTSVNNTTPVSNATTSPAGESETDKIQGELQVGKTDSVILYVGKETGDYAGYCFTNDSEAGRSILAGCKNGEQCEVTGTVDNSSCKVPGLEADLSASGKIVKVMSVKSLGRKK
jgi:protein involved in sex pheromone biosynthesis